MIEFRCEPLSKQHDRQRFSCESVELVAWFQHRARQDQQRRVAAVYAMVPEVEPARIAGFYTLSATSIILSDLPEKFSRKLPRYPMVPAILLGRLARDTAFPGVGEKLLLDAMNRALRSSKEIAAAAIVVDAKNDHAHHFYRRHGFEPITTDSNRLYVPMGTIEETFRG